jgi:hypothetical protein
MAWRNVPVELLELDDESSYDLFEVWVSVHFSEELSAYDPMIGPRWLEREVDKQAGSRVMMKVSWWLGNWVFHEVCELIVQKPSAIVDMRIFHLHKGHVAIC